MMGTRSPQDKLFAADQIYLDYVGRDTGLHPKTETGKIGTQFSEWDGGVP
jgi:hypothetical protein